MATECTETKIVQGNGAGAVILGRRTLGVVWGKPKAEMTKNVEARRIEQAIRIGVTVGSEEIVAAKILWKP